MTGDVAGPIRALIFDLDGTLVDSAPDLASAVNRMLAAMQMPERDPIVLAKYIGKGLARLVERSLTGDLEASASTGLLERAMPLFERFYAEESGRRASVYPGVMPGLEALRKQAVPLACVTNKARRFTGELLERLALARYFDVVVSGDTLPARKPDPAPLLHACTRLGVPPSQALVVGDSENDVAGARAAGCPVVCVPYGYNEGRPIESSGCNRVVADVREAAQLALDLRPPSAAASAQP